MSPFLLAFIAAAALAAPPIASRVHAPEVEERLGRLVGDWVIQGLPRTQFRQKCSWFSAKAFVLCSFDDRRRGITGQAAFGYSALDRRFTYSMLNSTGRSVRQLGFPSGAYGLVFLDERIEPRGPARIQTSMLVEDDGLRFIEYRSIAGGNWQQGEHQRHKSNKTQ